MTILEKIKKDGLLFDGAMGSLLIAKGLTPGEAPESWNIHSPEDILDIHRAYYAAGADVASANTFGASSMKLKKMGVSESMAKINRAGVELARQACGPDQFVAADIGDLGEMLAPMGPISPKEAVAAFADQAAVMADAGVDLFIIETMFDLNMALAAVQGIRSVTDIPVACSLTFKETPKGFFTIFGNGPADSMKALADEGCSMVGANCAMGSDTMIRLAGEIRQAVDIPVIVQPNAGLPQTGADTELTYPEDENEFADNLMAIKALGIDVVGGCCGTTPDYIRTVRQRLQEKKAGNL
ncbi:MAG TPA: methionine synthase I, cobalamin-binding domain-containing protein [Desulfobacteraceae bacterium]|nr:methionine synthase I, cobalamin-binding domain-containing protein [Desulfobacteraceae bacterium]|tara:strand:+ start:540 stop:1433 length:894 start_codon:yes stop_codon:yes gene_type:complete